MAELTTERQPPPALRSGARATAKPNPGGRRPPYPGMNRATRT